ncbi:MMPL family transporter [Streptomyces sp. NPDC006879]|uniref:MMPL family transporter n=1 Tax=Streptomyces sp. NPDC006879 TaxID=3364767 RepID=UPI0036B5C69E
MTTTPVRGQDGPVVPPTAHDRTFLERTAAFSQRHRWLALLLWTVLLVGVWGGASAVGDSYHDDFAIPGTETQEALETMQRHGSNQGGDSVQIVLHDQDKITAPAVRERIDAMLAKVAALPTIDQVRSPYEERSALSEDKTVGYATAVLKGTADAMPFEEAQQIYDTARSAHGDGLQVELGGDVARKLGESGGGAAEGAGMLAALVILGLMFGTVIAAGLPIITAVFAVGSTLGVIVLLSHVFTIASYTSYMMILVGLGVGIDYALLIFARYRSELVRGSTSEEATNRALNFAGRSVLFAGCTVIIALLGLVALGIGSLQGTAVAVALTVLVTMIASLTLLPALLSVFGGRFARQFPAKAARRQAKGRPIEGGTRWRVWAGAVQRRPLAALLVAGVALAALAAPALDMRLGLSDAGSESPQSTARKAYDLLSDGFGPGFNGPLVVVTEGDAAAREALGRTLNTTDGVAFATQAFPSADGKAATAIVFPETTPQAEQTSELVHRLRDEVLAELGRQTGARFLVGGSTTAVIDYSDTIAERMPIFIAIVVGLSLLLLIAVFRSVLIPLKAAVLNLLSIGASLGTITLVFQKGWFGVEQGPIEAYLPIMIFAISFGLAMDYEIFIVSRIREEWDRTGDATASIREGLAHTGSVVTAAGAIMVAVFGAFMLSGDRMLQQFGLGMAVGVFVDAVIIRCLIVPAAMQLMGRRAWWMPAALDRLLPKVEVEKSS